MAYDEFEDEEQKKRQSEEDLVSGDQQYREQQPQFEQLGQEQVPEQQAPAQQAQSAGNDSQAILDRLSKEHGAGIEASDLANLQGKNPEDREQFIRDLDEQYAKRGASTSHRAYDSQDTEAYDDVGSDPRTEPGFEQSEGTYYGNKPPQSQGGVPAQRSSPYAGFLGGGGGAGGGGGVGGTDPPMQQQNGLSDYLKQMQEQQQSDRTRQDTERQAMRDLLTNRMQQAGAPVDVNASGIKEQLSAQRLARQRSAERQQSQAAVRMGGQGLGDSGAMDTQLGGIEQARGEGESSDIAQVLGQEHQAKREELTRLYQMAVQMGDSEQARNIQQQLGGIEAQMSREQLSEGGRRFDQDLGFRKSSFMDDLGLRLAQMQQQGNQQAFQAFQ